MSSDEFDEYDFSEFTEEDLAWIDTETSQKLELRAKSSEALSKLLSPDAISNASQTGGPAIEIAVELETASGLILKTLPSVGELAPHASAHGNCVTPLQPALTMRNKPPFDQFLSWKKHFSVTDLVSPIWCELQHEYGLYGGRHRPLEQRPSSFTSKAGKEIRVHQHVAQTNDRRLERGKSVHRALEEELRPDKVVVHLVSKEERFGLRLVQLIDGFNELVINGLTRELPVFTITHNQVVLGVIDEVIRSPLALENQEQTLRTRRASTGPPGSPTKKKPRHSTSPPQQPITFSFSESPTKARGSSSATNGTNEAEVRRDELPVCMGPSCTSSDAHELRIIDYKTRMASYVPLDEETLSPRLQLMLYHRMLSSVLAPETFDFAALWARLNLNPTKPFSDRFLRDIKWNDRMENDHHVNLNRLVAEWTSTVHSERADGSRLTGVSPELQIVYRRSVFAGRSQRKGRDKYRETVDINNPLEALAFQEELDIARAIEESLRQIGHEEVGGRLAQAATQNVKQARSSDIGHTCVVWKQLVSPPGSEQGDCELSWTIQQSLLSCAHNTRAQIPRTTPTERERGHAEELTTLDISPIIGTKEFRMNDGQLDVHLADVLQWWIGARPARGVEVAQTNRCFTCEYQETCEWREKKAKETAIIALERSVRRAGVPQAS
ncbi:hypothetical protein BS17DRAFT_700546 [Gyrodon lividus]|nr:hypothetical protein BS17DRAFT_700546 [Gyrodon lividus]